VRRGLLLTGRPSSGLRRLKRRLLPFWDSAGRWNGINRRSSFHNRVVLLRKPIDGGILRQLELKNYLVGLLALFEEW